MVVPHLLSESSVQILAQLSLHTQMPTTPVHNIPTHTWAIGIQEFILDPHLGFIMTTVLVEKALDLVNYMAVYIYSSDDTSLLFHWSPSSSEWIVQEGKAVQSFDICPGLISPKLALLFISLLHWR
ncbi:hypothetical protein U1Q18_046487 [Sarracenia purpurea var. burkii]